MEGVDGQAPHYIVTLWREYKPLSSCSAALVLYRSVYAPQILINIHQVLCIAEPLLCSIYYLAKYNYRNSTQLALMTPYGLII